MPIEVQVATTIRRTRSVVASVMFDPRYEVEWVSGVRAVRWLDDGVLRAGSRIERQIRLRGRGCLDVAVVADHVPDRFIEFTAGRALRLRIRYALESIPEGTIARVHAWGEATGGLRLLTPILAALLRRRIIRDLDALKALLEVGRLRLVEVHAHRLPETGTIPAI